MNEEWEFQKCAHLECPFVAREDGNCVYHQILPSPFCDDITLQLKPCLAHKVTGEKKCAAHMEVSNYELFFGHEEDEYPLPPSPGMRKHVRKSAKNK